MIHTRTLACGMPLVVEPMAGVKSLGVTWLLGGGGFAHDDDRTEGVATMWAELLLRGAGDLDSRAQADAMDRAGCSRSADTGARHMRLSFTLLGVKLAEALPLITDMLRRPRMDDAAVEPTRDLAVQAIEGLKDDPQERASLTLKARHNPWPLNRSGMGTVEGLHAATGNLLREQWRRRVRPVGSVLALAGDIAPGEIDRLAKRLDELLAGWEGNAGELSLRESPTRGTYHHEPDESSQVQVMLMHDGPREASPDSALERVLNGVLSGGMASRLFAEVREKRGLCYAVSRSYAADRDHGRCVAYVGTTPERAQESLDLLTAELRRAVGDGDDQSGRVTADELQRALIGLRSSIVMSGESTGARAAALAGDVHRLGRARTLDEILALYAGVTLERVHEYQDRSRMGDVTLVTLGPGALRRPV